ncbi:MAG TPA: tripartite tricarboxylate transporter TctB family protein [Candidatus Methylomirabilis sp.]|nr:tripartite tricarboxylate transporter TctB family protein [Candidatus Methylomirabilis sp.]
MRKADAVCATLLMLIGAFVCFDASKHGIFGWGAAGPEAGMYPFLLGAGMILGSLVILAQTLFGERDATPDKPFFPPGALKPVLSVGIPATLMVLLTHFIGLYLAAGLYLAVYMRWIGRHRWISVATVSVLLPLAGYVLFQRWFQIPLPEGSLTTRFGF